MQIWSMKAHRFTMPRDYELPDIVSYLQNETNLTRRSIVNIIMGSGRLQDFKNNPQKFIEQVAAIIKHQMRIFIVDGIKYQKDRRSTLLCPRALSRKTSYMVI